MKNINVDNLKAIDIEIAKFLGWHLTTYEAECPSYTPGAQWSGGDYYYEEWELYAPPEVITQGTEEYYVDEYEKRFQDNEGAAFFSSNFQDALSLFNMGQADELVFKLHSHSMYCHYNDITSKLHFPQGISNIFVDKVYALLMSLCFLKYNHIYVNDDVINTDLFSDKHRIFKEINDNTLY